MVRYLAVIAVLVLVGLWFAVMYTGKKTAESPNYVGSSVRSHGSSGAAEQSAREDSAGTPSLLPKPVGAQAGPAGAIQPAAGALPVIPDDRKIAFTAILEVVVPELESGMSNGTIYFAGGNVTYGNFVIKPNAIEDLNPDAGFSLTYNDSRYIRNWMVGPTIDFPFGKEVKMPLPSMHGSIVASDLPDSTTLWSPIKAESRGIVNLSRKFGHADNDMRRLAWLKTTIESARAQERILNLGFSDEVWVFVNGQIIYTDKNYFGTPSQKFPKSRCTLENSHFTLPLKEGKNEMLIGLANYFFGWGVLARLDDMDGIHLMK